MTNVKATLINVNTTLMNVKATLMNVNRSFLGIYPGSQHTCGAKQNSDPPLIHCLNQFFTLLIGLRFLDKPNFVWWNIVILYKFAFDFRVNVPLPGLIRSQLRKHKLGS